MEGPSGMGILMVPKSWARLPQPCLPGQRLRAPTIGLCLGYGHILKNQKYYLWQTYSARLITWSHDKIFTERILRHCLWRRKWMYRCSRLLLVLTCIVRVFIRQLIAGRRLHTQQVLHQIVKPPPKEISRCPSPTTRGAGAPPSQRMVFVRQREVIEVLVSLHERLDEL